MLFEKFCELMNHQQNSTYEEFEKCRTEFRNMLVDADESIEQKNALIQELADELLPCRTTREYFGLTPKQRSIAQKVNCVLTQN